MDEGVTYSFGSPAIWNVVSRYCRLQDIQLPVRKILMAGAPVSGELIARVASIMPEDGEIHTPYGATEALPIVSIEGRELLADCWPLTRKGQGVCVGRPLPGITIRIIKPVDDVIDRWDQVDLLQSGEIGEIVVRGPVVTPGYEHNEQETALAKIRDDAGYWHRMGDMGYLDEQGRLWFCGRKAHVVHTKDGPMYTICCEAIFNNHLRVARSALVGLGERGQQKPVILVEVEGICDEEELFAELLELGRQSELTKNIDTFLLHPGFPVDIRHNAKIFREKLAVWAAKKLKNRKCEDGL
jgi:acyl-CoA synthetase (AMP-forming)/AMP-acid ligase II